MSGPATAAHLIDMHTSFDADGAPICDVVVLDGHVVAVTEEPA